MESLRYRKARTEDMEAVMALQTAVFHGEQLIPRDAVEAFLAMEPQVLGRRAGRRHRRHGCRLA